MFVYMHTCVPAETERGTRDFEARVMGNCELLDGDTGNHTWVLCKGCKHSRPQDHLSGPSFGLYVCWGFKLRSSCLCSKCSYLWSHLLSPSCVVFECELCRWQWCIMSKVGLAWEYSAGDGTVYVPWQHSGSETECLWVGGQTGLHSKF